jgi:uncharacterized protein (DUF433 family)
MSNLEATVDAPLSQWEDGSIRTTGSRVPIDSILYHFKLGATAEEIVYKFPSLLLVRVYGAIYFYLTHKEDIEQYRVFAAGHECTHVVNLHSGLGAMVLSVHRESRGGRGITSAGDRPTRRRASH